MYEKVKIILYDSICYIYWEYKYDLYWIIYIFLILILNVYI